MTTTYYLAGSWSARDTLRAYRDRLVAVDIAVTATWLTYEHQADLKLWAIVDQTDIILADGLILFTDTPSTSGGYWWELGYAMGRGKRVIGVGPINRPRPNLFCELVDEWYSTVDDLIAALAPVGVVG
jgi:hypothetical protein